MIVPSESFSYMYPFKNLIYTFKREVLSQTMSCSIETARSAHVPLKPYTREKSLATHYFYIQQGCARDRQDRVHMCLKQSYTREKSLHIISMFSGTVQGTDIGVPVCPKLLHKRKILTHYFYIQCLSSYLSIDTMHDLRMSV